MLKKVQRRFILSAMAAFGAVMLVIVIGINVVNYYQTTSMQDDLIRNLLAYERRALEEPKAPRPPVEGIPGRGPEDEFTTRFFTVHCDLSGRVRVISRDHISSVDEKTAEKYAQTILSRGREKGYYGDYRYCVKEEGEGIAVLFLNASREIQFMKTLLFVSLGIGGSGLLIVFILVVVFSGYAVRPYMKNLERQKRFITDAGHELKTPITSIATSADIAAMEYEGNEWIENIQKQTMRLSKLVGDLVALSRLDEEVPFPEKSVFSLSDAAWETAEPFAVLAKAEGKKYSQAIEEKLELEGERNAVQQMISILLDNAVKYSDGGGEIRLDIYRKRKKIYIEVFNTCDLSDISELERVFDRFYRLDESRSAGTGGTGIGLSMAQAIAENHGGRIEVKSQSGKTIRFRVLL